MCVSEYTLVIYAEEFILDDWTLLAILIGKISDWLSKPKVSWLAKYVAGVTHCSKLLQLAAGCQ